MTKTKTFDSIWKEKGTRFKFADDIAHGLDTEYMILPAEGDDYWITPIINIQPNSPFVGNICKFKSDDAIMREGVVLSQENKVLDFNIKA